MKLTLDISNRLLRRGQQAQYRAAVRLHNDFEYRFHSLSILHRAYTCQGILTPGLQARVAEGVSTGDVGSCSGRCLEQVLPKWTWAEASRFGCVSGYPWSWMQSQRKRVNGEVRSKTI